MSFISLYYLLFLSVVVITYFCFPKKHRWIVLLLASYIFYLINDLRYVIFLIITTLTVFFVAQKLKDMTEKQKEFFAQQSTEWLAENKKTYSNKLRKKRKIILIFTLIFNFSILFVFKYLGWLADAFADIINIDKPSLNILLPLGISFYMFQSIGYLVDVYFCKIEPQKNIFKFALFVSFFPQLIQGPISRYDQLSPQLINGNDFNYRKIKSGALLMIWGYFKKMVIADRVTVLYQAIMGNINQFQGFEIFVAMLCFVLKVYCDFSGGIDIAMGSAEMVGVNLTPNFNRPFFATSVLEYWRRWHITLGAWMKDYVLYPLTLSKGYNKFIRSCRKTFKNGVAGKVIPSGIAMFFVFLLVGVWHGPNLTYLLFGMYYGIIVLIETIINEVRKIKKIQPKQRNKHMKRFIIFLRFVLTFMLVYFGKYLSAAPDVATAWNWFKATFVNHDFSALFRNFIERTDFNMINIIISVVSTAFLIFIEVLQEKGIKIREKILSKHIIIQWIVFWAAIVLVVLLAYYGGTGGGFVYENV